MDDKPGTTPSDFLAAFFGAGSTAPVFVTSLPNERGDGPERPYLGRDRLSIDGHVAKWDRPGRGAFFCVAALRPGAQPPAPGKSVRCKANVAEIVCCHGDIDLKSVTIGREALIAALLSLEMPPSLIVWSGRGVHCYWLFNEPQEADEAGIARIEAMNARLSDVIGGDIVQDVTRLMRLPGSHNTKDGGWLAVEIVHARWSPRYEVGDIEDWLDRAGPVIRRKVPEKSAPAAANPWLAVAASLGFKPPVDVERRLSAMSYQGAGETSIHGTQLAVSAALLSRGEPVEEVVDILMQATRAAAGEHGARWRWDREERTIRNMAGDWLRKHPEIVTRAEAAPEATRAQAKESARDETRQAEAGEARSNGTTGATVHSLKEARAKRKKESAGKAGEPELTVVLGSAVLEALRVSGGDILFMSKAAWVYGNGLWRMELDIVQWLNVRIETAVVELNVKSNSRTVNEVRNWIMRRPELWRDDVAWDGHGKIATRSGLIDLKSMDVEPVRPDHFCTWRIECDYDPAARCPRWERMLSDFFGDRTPEARSETVSLVQEILGMALAEDKPKALTKALILQGGSDSGKTSVLEVLSGLLSDRPISMPLEAVGGTHGLMEFVRRAPWVIHEAFDQSKWHFSSLVKSILTGDPVQINLKSGPLLTQRIRSPVFWGTNHPPQFKEATKAIVNRLIVLKCRQVFNEAEPVGVAKEARAHGYSEPSRFIVETEKAGLLNWAIVGLLRARARGYFHLPDEVIETRDEIRSDSNLVDGFVRECVSFNAYGMIATPDFCAAFTVWWHENKGENRGGPSNDAIGRALSSLGDARIASHRDLERRYYLGLTLNKSGMDYWRASSSSSAAQGKTSRISSDEQSVNRTIPVSWDGKEQVLRMRAAFEKAAEEEARKVASAKGKNNEELHDASHDTSSDMTLASVISGEPQF